MNKIITLELLMRYDEHLRRLIKTLPIDPSIIEKESITKEKLEKVIQDAIDKAMSALQAEDIAGDREKIEQNKADADQKIADIEAIIQEIMDAVHGNTESINSSIGEVNQRVNDLNDAIQTVKDDKDADIAILNEALVTTNTALEGVQGDITGIKQDIGALDGLNNLKEKIEGIEDIVDALEKQDLTSYVKKEELEDGILTTMVEYDLLDDGKNVRFYTKEEFPSKVEEQLGDYITDGDLQSYNFYDEEKTAAKVKEMILSGEGDSLNQGLLEKTAEYMQSQYTSYVDGKLQDYSTIAQTSKAITDIVGEINVAEDGTIAAQLSTINQTAEAIESAVATVKDDLTTNYSNTLQTSELIDSKVATYVDGELANYSTTEQTAEAIKTEIAKIEGPDMSNYYTKTETAEAISQVLYAKNITDEDGVVNVYTKDETADEIKTQLIEKGVLDSEGDMNIYTKTETANEISTAVQSYVDDELKSYSTTEQTSESIKAHLRSIGVTDEDDSLIVITPEYIESTVRGLSEEVDDKISQVVQSAEGITSAVVSLSDNVETNATAIAQLNDSIGLCVKEEDIDGNSIINRINMDSTSTTIDGKYLHVTGATVFDDNVTIRGNMTSGSINCNGDLTISGGAVTLDKNGITIANSNGGKMKLDQDGMNFYDSANKKFAAIGRFAAGICHHDEVVDLGWDVAPKLVLLSPYTLKASVAGNTANDMFIKCYATDITKDNFKAVCCTTVYGIKPSAPYTLAAQNFSAARTNASTDYNNVDKQFTTASLKTPSSSTKTVLSGTIEFAATGTQPTGFFATATNENLVGLAGSNLTVTATPEDGYSIADSDISITNTSSTVSLDNTYTAVLGAHDHATVVMTSDRAGYDKVGITKAYIDIYVDSVKVNTITAYSGDATASVKYPMTNISIDHSGGSEIKFVCRATWNYLADQYIVNQGVITAVSQVSDPTDITISDKGTATYIALG